MKTPGFAFLFGTITSAEFASTYLGRACCLKSGPSDRFDGLTPIRLRDLTRELERVWGGRVVERAEGTGQCDVLVLRLSGDNRWTLGSDTVMVRAGDVVYVPASLGYPATGESVRELRYEIRRPNGLDLLGALLESRREHPALRAAIPRDGAPDEQMEFANQVRRLLANTLRAPQLLTQFLTLHDEFIPFEPLESEAFDPSPETAQWVVLSSPRAMNIRRADAATISICAGGNTVAFPEDAAPLLQFVANEAPAPVAQFYSTFAGQFDREELVEFLRALSGASWIVFRGAQDVLA